VHDDGLLLAEAGDPDFGLGIVALAGQGHREGETRDAVGWVACDQAPDWIELGGVLLRYGIDPISRQNDGALRAVQLLMHHLATRSTFRTACLRVGPDDTRSLGVAQAAGFTRPRRAGDDLVFTRPVPPLTYTDGTVTIRRQQVSDLEGHLQSADEAQIEWLWAPGERERWEGLTADQRREHCLAHLRGTSERFGSGPKWCFSADRPGADYVAYVDCDLAGDHVPPGEANISYASHPKHRGEGNVSPGRAMA
jgi:hypothetical protein